MDKPIGHDWTKKSWKDRRLRVDSVFADKNGNRSRVTWVANGHISYKHEVESKLGHAVSTQEVIDAWSNGIEPYRVAH